MAKLLAVFDYDFQALAADREAYASDPTVQVTTDLDRYIITFEDFEPRSGAVTTQSDGGSFNLVDLLDSASMREYRVIL